jgi:hypothetical protein
MTSLSMVPLLGILALATALYGRRIGFVSTSTTARPLTNSCSCQRLLAVSGQIPVSVPQKQAQECFNAKADPAAGLVVVDR